MDKSLPNLGRAKTRAQYRKIYEGAPPDRSKHRNALDRKAQAALQKWSKERGGPAFHPGSGKATEDTAS